MTADPSIHAIRAKLWREQRKSAPVPPDVKALLERGLREQQELRRQSMAVRALAQIETMVARKLLHIQNIKQPAIRSRLLGELADWIIERRKTLADIAAVKTIRPPINRAKSRRVPTWVPADLVPVYLDPMIGEFEAASIVRAMKREAAGG